MQSTFGVDVVSYAVIIASAAGKAPEKTLEEAAKAKLLHSTNTVDAAKRS